MAIWHYKPVRLSPLEHKKKTSEECFMMEVNGDCVSQAPKKALYKYQKRSPYDLCLT